jgi:hypothetical protein
MSTYQELKGLKVKYLSSDTSGDRAIEGEVFYNSPSGKVASHIAAGAWSAGSNLITGRNDLAGFGTQTATACFGGVDATAVSNDTEEYNGFGWSAGEDMPSAVYEHAGTGTLTAGLSVGGTLPGAITNVTNEYDGTDWAAGGNYPAATIRLQACGTQTAALAAGGGTPPISAVVCEYNGSAWTANPSPSGDLPAAIQYHRMTGILTSAVSFGGGPSGPVTGATATYNGTAWTAQTATLNDTRSRLGGAGETDSSSVAFGGFAPNGTVNTELWDGSSWTEVGNMGTARYALAGTGTKSSALGSGGYTSGRLSATEEWNISISTTTAAAWSSGEALNQIRRVGAGTGTQTSGMIFGGLDTSTALGHTEQYDGTDWTEVGDLNTARGKLGSATAGSQTAALGFGGSTSEPSNPAIVNNSEEFNGTSWAEGDNLNTARYVIAGAGTQTAGLGFGGYTTSTNRDESEEYNGTSWSEGDNLNTARGYLAGCGTQTAGLAIQGFQDGGEGEVSKVEEYNGTSWTEVTNVPFTSRKNCAAGIQTNAITFAGHNNRTDVVGYDGTTWSTRPSMATGRDFASGFGTATAAVCAGGDGGTPGDEGVNTVEEFTGDTTALGTAKTIDFD